METETITFTINYGAPAAERFQATLTCEPEMSHVPAEVRTNEVLTASTFRQLVKALDLREAVR